MTVCQKKSDFKGRGGPSTACRGASVVDVAWENFCVPGNISSVLACKTGSPRFIIRALIRGKRGQSAVNEVNHSRLRASRVVVRGYDTAGSSFNLRGLIPTQDF